MTHRTLAPARRFAIVAAAAVLPASFLHAADRTWIGTGLKGRGGDGTTFISPANWSPAAVPGSLDRAIFNDVGGEISFPAGLVINDRLLVSGHGLVLLFDVGGGLYRLNSAGAIGSARSFLMSTQSDHSASLEVANGTMTSKHAALATAPGSEAALTIWPDGGLHATSSLTIGEAGSASVEAFGELLTGEVTLAKEAGSSGSLKVDGMSSLLLAFGNIKGGAGATELRLQNGALAAIIGDLALGQPRSSSVDASVTGLGTALLVEGDILLGGIDDHGGLGGLTVDAEAQVRGEDLVLGPSFALDILGGRLDCTSVEAAAAPIGVEVGSLVIGGPDIAVEPGVFAGFGPEPSFMTLTDGATLTAPTIGLGRVPGSTTEAIVDGPGSAVAALDLLELGWPAVDTASGLARLIVRNGAQADAGTLSIRQGGWLTTESGAVEAGFLQFPDDYGVLRGRFLAGTSSPFVRALDGALLGGALTIEQKDPATSPVLGTVLPAIESPWIDGRLAAVLAQPLPGLKYYKALPYGSATEDGGSDAVAFEVSKLNVAVGLIAFLPIELPGTPNAIVAGLYDGDGLPDVFVTIPGENGEPGLGALLINTTLPFDGDGVAPPPSFVLVGTIALGSEPSGLSAGDINRDGRPDFVVSDSGDGTIQIIYNAIASLQGGVLDPGPVIPVGGRPRQVMAADLNGSGILDLVWTDDQAGEVYTAFATGPGSYGPPKALASGPQPVSVCPLDLDNDKDLDLAVLNTGATFGPGLGGSTVGIHINLSSQGAEDFAAVVLYPVGDGVVGIAEGDLDDDGIVDLVTADADGNNISILIGRGDGTFRPAVQIAASGSPIAIAAGDIDGTNDLDIAVIVQDQFGNPSLTIFRNDSANGQLVLTILENAETIFGLPQAMTAVDADQDGPADLLLVGGGTRPGSGVVTVVQSVPVVCPADFDGDGEVDGADLGIMLSAFGPNPGHPADLNLDGVVNEVDLLLLLKGFGSCVGGEE